MRITPSKNDLAGQEAIPFAGGGSKTAYEESGPGWEMGGGNYFKEVLIEPNFWFIVLHGLFTTVMIASAMPAAIRPYSIAVAPDSSDQDLRIATKC